jgi:hypothetical protein
LHHRPASYRPPWPPSPHARRDSFPPACAARLPRHSQARPAAWDLARDTPDVPGRWTSVTWRHPLAPEAWRPGAAAPPGLRPRAPARGPPLPSRKALQAARHWHTMEQYRPVSWEAHVRGEPPSHMGQSRLPGPCPLGFASRALGRPTLALTCCQQRERRRSGRCWQSGAVRGSARICARASGLPSAAIQEPHDPWPSPLAW